MERATVDSGVRKTGTDGRLNWRVVWDGKFFIFPLSKDGERLRRLPIHGASGS